MVTDNFAKLGINHDFGVDLYDIPPAILSMDLLADNSNVVSIS